MLLSFKYEEKIIGQPDKGSKSLIRKKVCISLRIFHRYFQG